MKAQVDAFARLVTAIENAARLDDPPTPTEREAYEDDAARDQFYEGITFLDEWRAGKR